MPEQIEKIYKTHYKNNREGGSLASFLAQKMESWLHKKVANDISGKEEKNLPTLEIGAGTLNQLHYESNVHPYDIIEPFTELYKNSPLLKKVRSIYADIRDVPSGNRYERITSVATFEHLCNLPDVVARSGLLLTENGVLRVSIPNEGNFLWTLGWTLTTGLEFQFRYGQDYGLLMKHEHVNTADEIEGVLKIFFENINCRIFGMSKYLALYRYYECRKPKIDECKKYIY
ncbi:MAG: class I SAM-dependent methyltransferase [Spirochaetia bacterium]|nr:class I SAM-dependent methyltransferase [Spirochaetia bacterium]